MEDRMNESMSLKHLIETRGVLWGIFGDVWVEGPDSQMVEIKEARPDEFGFGMDSFYETWERLHSEDAA